MKPQNNQGLWINEETNTVIGYLFDTKGHGVFSPDGKVEVPPESVEIHNKLLSQGEISGLDNHCIIKQGGTFYYSNGKVTTFIGEVVSDNIKKTGKSITFYRKNKVYRGILQKDADCFNFKRIA